MTKNEMRAKLLHHVGIGVRVTTITGFTNYFFYEDFEDEYGNVHRGIDRAYKHFCHNDSLVFYSNVWAEQEEFKEYLKHFNRLKRIAAEYPKNEMVQYQLENFEEFIVHQLMKFTGFSQRKARSQILRNSISYSKFKGKVAL